MTQQAKENSNLDFQMADCLNLPEDAGDVELSGSHVMPDTNTVHAQKCQIVLVTPAPVDNPENHDNAQGIQKSPAVEANGL
jgi:hypothetical protein